MIVIQGRTYNLDDKDAKQNAELLHSALLSRKASFAGKDERQKTGMEIKKRFRNFKNGSQVDLTYQELLDVGVILHQHGDDKGVPLGMQFLVLAMLSTAEAISTMLNAFLNEEEPEYPTRERQEGDEFRRVFDVARISAVADSPEERETVLREMCNKIWQKHVRIGIKGLKDVGRFADLNTAAGSPVEVFEQLLALEGMPSFRPSGYVKPGST